jgi:hypothetical protein
LVWLGDGDGPSPRQQFIDRERYEGHCAVLRHRLDDARRRGPEWVRAMVQQAMDGHPSGQSPGTLDHELPGDDLSERATDARRQLEIRSIFIVGGRKQHDTAQTRQTGRTKLRSLHSWTDAPARPGRPSTQIEKKYARPNPEKMECDGTPSAQASVGWR